MTEWRRLPAPRLRVAAARFVFQADDGEIEGFELRQSARGAPTVVLYETVNGGATFGALQAIFQGSLRERLRSSAMSRPASPFVIRVC